MVGWRFHMLSSSVFLILLSYSIVYGAESGRISIQPVYSDKENPLTKSWFVYALNPGQQKQDKVRILNHTSENINVKLYPGDGKTINGGGFSLTDEEEKKSGLGSWIKLSQKELVLKPYEYRDIDFTIAIPENVNIGDHAGGIIVQETDPQLTTQQGIKVSIVSRVGVRIYQTVEGDKKYDLVLQKVKKIIQDNTFYHRHISNISLDRIYSNKSYE